LCQLYTISIDIRIKLRIIVSQILSQKRLLIDIRDLLYVDDDQCGDEVALYGKYPVLQVTSEYDGLFVPNGDPCQAQAQMKRRNAQFFDGREINIRQTFTFPKGAHFNRMDLVQVDG
jgi:hypothetical protein